MKDNSEKIDIINNKEKTKLSKVINIILWIILFIWMGVCLTDFYNVKNEKEPMFCIKKGTTKYDDGTVDYCIGAGYKIYYYNRQTFNAIEFGPIWSKDRSVQETK